MNQGEALNHTQETITRNIATGSTATRQGTCPEAYVEGL